MLGVKFISQRTQENPKSKPYDVRATGQLSVQIGRKKKCVMTLYITAISCSGSHVSSLSLNFLFRIHIVQFYLDTNELNCEGRLAIFCDSQFSIPIVSMVTDKNVNRIHYTEWLFILIEYILFTNYIVI